MDEARALSEKEFNDFLGARAELERLINVFIANPNNEKAAQMHAAAETLVEHAQRTAAARLKYLTALTRPRRASSDGALSGI